MPPAAGGPAGPGTAPGTALPGTEVPSTALPGTALPGTGVTGTGVTGTGGTGRAAGWSRARLVLTVLAGALALLCFGGAGVGYLLYDRATRPDRSAPDVATSNYLRAQFVERDDDRIRLFQCADGSGLGAIRQLRAEIEQQEQRLETMIIVSWGELVVERADETSATVRTSVRRTAMVDGALQSLADDWRFSLVEEDGWRVCGAEKLA